MAVFECYMQDIVPDNKYIRMNQIEKVFFFFFFPTHRIDYVVAVGEGVGSQRPVCVVMDLKQFH